MSEVQSAGYVITLGGV